MGQDFLIKVTLKFDNIISAESKEQAKDLLIAQFLDDYNIELEDHEIEFVESWQNE